MLVVTPPTVERAPEAVTVGIGRQQITTLQTGQETEEWITLVTHVVQLGMNTASAVAEITTST